jgi:FdrA protein
VVRYLGQARGSRRDGVIYATDLDEAARAALALLEGRSPGDTPPPAPDASLLEPGAGRLVGLFGGGSLASEAALILAAAGHVTGSPEAPLAAGRPIPGEGHLVVDLGDDVYTVGKPHPMVDQTTRCGVLRAAAADPRVGLVLLDLVLGDGSHADPAPELVQALEEGRRGRAGASLAVVASITGTDRDPQDAGRQRALLAAAGVVVAPSATQAARLAAAWLDRAPERRPR